MTTGCLRVRPLTYPVLQYVKHNEIIVGGGKITEERSNLTTMSAPVQDKEAAAGQIKSKPGHN
jgi:hypothetical protein